MSTSEIDQIVQFLEEKRNIPTEICERFRLEKMDLAAVKEAKDEELQILGLIRRGDILALRAFVEGVAKATTADRKRSLLGVLKQKFASGRVCKKKKTETLEEKPRGGNKITTRKIRVGWQHFDRKQKRYISIRLVNGGGTRDINVAMNATKEEIIDQLKSVFFPEGKSTFGTISEMRFSLGNFQCEEVNDESFTLGQYIARYRLSRCRLYLMTKLYEDIFSISDSDDEMPLPFTNDDIFDYPTQTSRLIGTSSERNSLLEQQREEYKISLAKDEEKAQCAEDSVHLECQQEKALEDEKLLRLLEAKVPAEPGFDEEHVKVSVRHVSLGYQTRRFPSASQISSIYDWVRSLCLHPSSFTLSTCDIAYLHPTMPVTMVDKTLIRMSENFEEVEPIVNLTDVNTMWETQCSRDQSAFNISALSERPPQVILEADDINPEVGVAGHDDNQVDSTHNDGCFTEPSNVEDCSTTTRTIKIRRLNVMEDVITNFKDESVSKSPIKIVMINAFGKEELGIDDGGVLSDVLSAFWSSFYDSCTLGEAERVPAIRHDFKDGEWEAIGRIIVKGFQEVQYYPVMLNRVFMLSIMFDGVDIPEELLLNSFLAYVSQDERELLLTALKEDDLSEEQDKELIQFLDRFNARRVPMKGGRRAIVLELAHKELVQRANFVIECWKKPLQLGLRNVSSFSSIQDIETLYEVSKPTVKRVLNLIIAEPTSNAERDVVSFLRRYIRGMDNEKLMKFLRFCTGASMICVKELRISFSNIRGLARRPVAHTCGCVLELPVTYESFPQFREEMNNVLSCQYWDIDIA